MEKIKKCIVCSSDEHADYLKCTDNLVSKETFVLKKCKKCGFVFTNPRPDINHIQQYYKSEDYYSHQNKNKSIISFVYNIVRNVNIKRKLNLIKKKTVKQGKLMDYGCGAGLFIKAAKKHGWDVSGIEPNKDAREVAKSLGVSVLPIEELNSLQNQSYDVITLWHVLEHIHELEQVIDNLRSLLKDDGTLVIAVPNIESWDAKKYKEKWAAYDVPRHLYHFSPTTMELLFTKFGMRIVSKLPMKFDSYYVSLLSEDRSWLAYFKAFINGLRSNINARSTANYSSIIYLIQ